MFQQILSSLFLHFIFNTKNDTESTRSFSHVTTMVKAPTSNITNTTIKFLCSYGGKIVPRHSDGLLRYSGGLTRFLSVDRSISFSELMVKMAEFCGYSVVLRCQLPDGDLETLVTLKSDEDLANIIEEYDQASKSAPRSLSIRAVLSPPTSIRKVSSSSSVDSDGSPRRFPHVAATSTCSGGCCSPQKSVRKVSPSQSVEFTAYRFPYGGRCYSPTVGYSVGLKSEAEKLRYYPFGAAVAGKPRFSYRAPHCH